MLRKGMWAEPKDGHPIGRRQGKQYRQIWSEDEFGSIDSYQGYLKKACRRKRGGERHRGKERGERRGIK